MRYAHWMGFLLGCSALACGGGALDGAKSAESPGAYRRYAGKQSVTASAGERFEAEESGGRERDEPAPMDEVDDVDHDGIADVDDRPMGGSAAGDFGEAKNMEFRAVSRTVDARATEGMAAPPVPKPPPAPGQSSGAGQPGSPQSNSSAQPDIAARNAAEKVEHGKRKGMLVYTANFTMSVYQVEPALDTVEKIANELGGYLASRSDNRIVVRVPRDKYDEAIRRVEKTGDVLHREMNAADVTDEFVDLEARLKNARNMQKRLSQLLERAPVKEALAIEKELGRVTQEIERLEGRLKVLRDRIAFSTITVAYQGRGSAALRGSAWSLPFSWVQGLGLRPLLQLNDGDDE